MLNIQKIKWVILPLCLLLMTGLAQQNTPQSQTNTQTESKAFVYQNVRISITERGVVAGDLRTGKVVWRVGFWESPDFYLLPNETRFFGEYLFLRFVNGPLPNSAALFYSLTGKKVVNVTDFYFKENSFYYFDNIRDVDYMEKSLSDIVVLEFDSSSKALRVFRFEVERIFVREKLTYCFTDVPGRGLKAEFFKPVSKKGSIWLFALSNKKCDMQIQFDDSDPSKYSINTKRKNK